MIQPSWFIGKSPYFNEVAIVCVKKMNYYVHILFIARDQTINILKDNAWKFKNGRL